MKSFSLLHLFCEQDYKNILTKSAKNFIISNLCELLQISTLIVICKIKLLNKSKIQNKMDVFF